MTLVTPFCLFHSIHCKGLFTHLSVLLLSGTFRCPPRKEGIEWPFFGHEEQMSSLLFDLLLQRNEQKVIVNCNTYRAEEKTEEYYSGCQALPRCSHRLREALSCQRPTTRTMNPAAGHTVQVLARYLLLFPVRDRILGRRFCQSSAGWSAWGLSLSDWSNDVTLKRGGGRGKNILHLVHHVGFGVLCLGKPGLLISPNQYQI